MDCLTFEKNSSEKKNQKLLLHSYSSSSFAPLRLRGAVPRDAQEGSAHSAISRLPVSLIKETSREGEKEKERRKLPPFFLPVGQRERKI